MKVKILVGMLISLFAVSVVSLAVPPNDKANEKAKGKAKAPTLESVEFIHWKKGFAKPPCNGNGICEPQLGENRSCADCKSTDDQEPSAADCYAIMGKYGKTLLKWRGLPVSYVINPQNPDGLTPDFVKQAIQAGAEEWDSYTTAELYDDNVAVNYDVQYGVADGKNAIVFGDYTTAGVIAVTKVWYNPATKAIVEFDIKFDTDWTWGDAQASNATEPDDPDAVMDVQNIAAHELGHAVGLADVYEPECADVTMYGYSDYEETQKSSLEDPDIIGINTLYE
ncbi:MAG: matrixin family metalloprotease [Planctomycetota bacterium]